MWGEMSQTWGRPHILSPPAETRARCLLSPICVSTVGTDGTSDEATAIMTGLASVLGIDVSAIVWESIVDGGRRRSLLSKSCTITFGITISSVRSWMLRNACEAAKTTQAEDCYGRIRTICSFHTLCLRGVQSFEQKGGAFLFINHTVHALKR